MDKTKYAMQRVIINGVPHVVIGSAADHARSKVSRSARNEYDTEKRILEMNAKMPCGHIDAKAVALAKMTNRPEHQVKKILRNRKKSKVVLDGKIN